MEGGACETKTFLSSAQGTEILGCLGGDICSEFHYDSARRSSTNSNIKENFRICPETYTSESEKKDDVKPYIEVCVQVVPVCMYELPAPHPHGTTKMRIPKKYVHLHARAAEQQRHCSSIISKMLNRILF